MKLRWYDRILVALSGLVLAALGVMIVLCGCGAVHLPEPFALDVWTGGDWQWLPAIFLGGLLVFLWGILARRRKARKAAAAQDETLDQSENKS